MCRSGRGRRWGRSRESEGGRRGDLVKRKKIALALHKKATTTTTINHHHHSPAATMPSPSSREDER